MKRKLLDSLQKQIIAEIKRETKKDLGYDSSTKTFVNATRYMTSFKTHVKNWTEAKLSEYGYHLTQTDCDIITNEMAAWVEKIEKTCSFY